MCARGFLVLLWLLTIGQIGAIFEHGDIKPDGDQYLFPGDTFQAECILDPDYEHYDLFNASDMYFMGGVDIIHEHTHPSAHASLTLTLKNVSESDVGKFYCALNTSKLQLRSDELLAATSLTIMDPPKPVEKFKCISDNFESMTCDWCDDPSVGQDYVKHILYWKISWPVECAKGAFECRCRFGVDKENHFFNGYNYSMVVVSSNQAGVLRNQSAVSKTFHVDPRFIVKPAQVGSATATSSANRTAVINFKRPTSLAIALFYQVNLTSKWGEEFVIDNISSASDVSVLAPHLTPATSYDIVIRCKPEVGGYWSDEVFIQVSTQVEAPDAPPVLPVGAFRLQPSSDCTGRKDCRELHLFWAPMEEKLQNGVIERYTVTYQSLEGEPESVSVPPNTLHRKLYLGLDLTFISLSASTSAGEGPSVSFHVENSSNVPAHPKIEYVERLSTDAVFFKWEIPPLEESVIGFTLLGCQGHPSVQACTGAIWNVSLAANVSQYLHNGYNSEDVYALTTNVGGSSSGMQDSWLCVYTATDNPEAPIIALQSMQEERSLRVQWDPLQCNQALNNPRIQNYVIYFTEEESNITSSLEVPQPQGKALIPHLKPFTFYEVWMCAVSVNNKTGLMSDRIITQTLESAPDLPPSNVNIVTIMSDRVLVEWSETAAPNGNISGYVITISADGLPVEHEASPLDRSAWVDGLYGYTNYSAVVYAATSAGLSPPSASQHFFTPVGAPGPVAILNATNTDSDKYLTVHWSPPDPANGPLDHYTVHFDWTRHGVNASTFDDTNVPFYEWVAPCEADGEYEVITTVRAVNHNGTDMLRGETSQPLAVTVCSDPAPINLLKVLLPLFAVIAIFSLLTALWLKCKYTERIKNCLNVPIERVQTTERPMTERINNKTSDYVCLGDSCEASSSSSTNSSELSPSSTQTKHSSLSSSSGFSGDSPNPSSVTSSELPPSDPSSSSGFTGDSSKTSSFTSSDDLCPPTSTSDSQSSSSGINSSPSLTSNQGPSSSTGVYMRVRYKDITPKEPAKEICVDSNDRDLLAVCLSNNTSDCSSVGLESPIEDDYCRQAKIHSSAPLEEPNEIRVDDDDPELAAHLAKRVETPCSSQSTVLEMSTESKKRHSPHQSAGDFESETVVDSCSIEMENLGDAGTTSDHDAEEVPSDVEGTDATADVQVESSQCILTQFGDKADNSPSSILPSITRSNILPSLSDTNSVPESRILPSFCIPTPSTSPFHLDGGVSPDEGIHSMEFPENGTISEDPSDRLEEDLDGNMPTYGGHYITGAHESQA